MHNLPLAAHDVYGRFIPLRIRCHQIGTTNYSIVSIVV